MSINEFVFLKKSIPIVKKKELRASYKVRSYTTKLKSMEENKIPQKPIEEVLSHLFSENKVISEKTKKSISKVIYCIKDRIIIPITKYGREIITARDKLIKNYGWFFFVSETDPDSKRKKVKKKREQKIEKTISLELYQFKDLVIPLKQKVNMRSLYRTKEYNNYLKLIKSKQISQTPIKDVLEDFFLKNELIPLEEKTGIRKIIYYQQERVIVLKALIAD